MGKREEDRYTERKEEIKRNRMNRTNTQLQII
jgi:hypothetical protein